MRLIWSVLITVLFGLFNVTAQEEEKAKGGYDANPMALIETEREFARMSVEKGIKAAFIEYLAEDSIIFPRGVPVNGRKVYTEIQGTGGFGLTWYPIFAQVSAFGDLGYSTGPYEYRADPKTEKADIYGTFLTVWKRQADGAWKAVLDRGVFHQKPAEALVLQTLLTAPKPKDTEKMNPERERAKIKDLDAKLSAETFKKGEARSLLRVADKNIRVYRENKFPLVGIDAARAALLTEPGILSWKPQFEDISKSGDLGYFYGVYQLRDKAGADGKVIEEGTYVRIWKKQPDGKWKVALDLLRSSKKSG